MVGASPILPARTPLDALARRIEAIAFSADPTTADLDTLTELIDLADELDGDADLEIEDDEESLSFIADEGPGRRSLAVYGLEFCDLEDESYDLEEAGDERDPWECLVHLPGGNGPQNGGAHG